MTAMSDDGPSRRAVLAGAGAALLAGCTSTREREVMDSHDRVDPDVRVRAAVVAEVRRLAALYDATLAAHPAMRPVVEPFRAETAAHLSALGGRSPTSSPSPGATAASRAPVVPTSTAEAQALLARAERSAADALVGQLGNASPGLARLVASVAASEAVHAALLGVPR